MRSTDVEEYRPALHADQHRPLGMIRELTPGTGNRHATLEAQPGSIDVSDNPFDLAGKVAMISGGNRGLGEGMALGLAAAGADIVIACRDRAAAGPVVDRVKAAGRRAVAVPCDVTSSASVDRAVTASAEAVGGLDILVNNAGTLSLHRPEDMPHEAWDRVMDTNIRGAFLLSKAAWPHMKEAGGGKVINIASMYSIFGGENDSAYASSKGALVQFTRACAVAWARDGIQVNAILPGWFVTDMTRPFLEGGSRAADRTSERVPAGRWGDPCDLAGTVVFLASRASDYVTGASIVVDGGFSIRD